MLDSTDNETLPEIPAKRYFTIGEVSKLCRLKPYILRHWEKEFDRLSPVKRRGNRRYYQRHEVELVRKIRELLYVEGYTTNGARARVEQLIESGELVLKDVSGKHSKAPKQQSGAKKTSVNNVAQQEGHDTQSNLLQEKLIDSNNQDAATQESSEFAPVNGAKSTSTKNHLESLLKELKSIRATLEK